MSGHSKWSTIKHKKGKEYAKRGQLFSKLSRAIMVAAKEGGADPSSNAALEAAIDKARSYSMPKDNIERAIQRGSGQGGGDAFESITYEGYGPAGVAIIVETLTDNRNRTAAEVRSAFTKHNGNLAEPGAVSWVFDRRGSVLIAAEGISEDDVMTAALEAGADDVLPDGDGYQIVTDPAALHQVRNALAAAGIAYESAELTLIPGNTVALGEADARRVLRLIDTLEDSDDVQDVYANFDIPDEILEAVAD